MLQRNYDASGQRRAQEGNTRGSIVAATGNNLCRAATAGTGCHMLLGITPGSQACACCSTDCALSPSSGPLPVHCHRWCMLDWHSPSPVAADARAPLHLGRSPHLVSRPDIWPRRSIGCQQGCRRPAAVAAGAVRIHSGQSSWVLSSKMTPTHYNMVCLGRTDRRAKRREGHPSEPRLGASWCLLFSPTGPPATAAAVLHPGSRPVPAHRQR